MNPGEDVIADISIVSVDYFAGKLSVGDEFVFTEGHRIIGAGIILEIVNENLLKSSINL